MRKERRPHVPRQGQRPNRKNIYFTISSNSSENKGKALSEPVKPASNSRVQIAGHCPFTGQQFRIAYPDSSILSSCQGVL
jgi:hypothetical protein